jgi:putative transposase
MLRVRTDAWFKRQERIGYHETSSLLTALKKDSQYAWLGDVSSVPIQQALRHLHTAFNNFFAKRAQYPSFKSKHGRQSATYAASAFRWDGKVLYLAKMKEPLVAHHPQGSEGIHRQRKQRPCRQVLCIASVR